MSKDEEYIEPLKLFKNRTLISVTNNDMSVPFGSSSIRSYNPYHEMISSSNKLNILGVFNFPKEIEKSLFNNVNIQCFDETYLGNDNENGYFCDNVKHVEYHFDTYYNLNQINWRRLDIEFKIDEVYQAFAIHDLVIMKDSPTFLLLTDELKNASLEFQEKIYELFEKDLSVE